MTEKRSARPAATGTGASIGKTSAPLSRTASPGASPDSVEGAKIARSPREVITITRRETGERKTVEVRVHSRSGGQLFPTSEGVSIPVDLGEVVAAAIARAAKRPRKPEGGR